MKNFEPISLLRAKLWLGTNMFLWSSRGKGTYVSHALHCT